MFFYFYETHKKTLINNRIFYLFWTDLSLLDYLLLSLTENFFISFLRTIGILQLNSVSDSISMKLDFNFKVNFFFITYVIFFYFILSLYMVYNFIFFLFLVVFSEILLSKDFFKLLGFSFSLVFIIGIFITLLSLELLGLTIIIIYSSVFITFILISLSFYNKDIYYFRSNKNFLFLLFCYYISVFYLFYFSIDAKLYTFFWVDYLNILNSNWSSFLIIMHKLCIKLFFIETLVINLYLLFSLLSCLFFLEFFKFLKNTKIKVNYAFKLKRVNKKKFSSSSFIKK